MRQRTEITFEMEETVVIRNGNWLSETLCENCGSTSGMASPSILARLAEVSERQIFRLIESGTLQCVESDRLLVCSNCFSNTNRETLES